MSEEYASFLRGTVDEIVFLNFIEEIHVGQIPVLKKDFQKSLN